MQLHDTDKAPSQASETAFGAPPERITDLPVKFLFEFKGSADHDTFGTVTGGAMGNRSVFEVKWGRVEGPNFQADVVHPSADWATDHPDGRRMLDVRITLKTDDGHYVLMLYDGMILGQRIEIAPRFQADGDGPYAWMNLIQGVGFGQRNEDMSLTYRVYHF